MQQRESDSMDFQEVHRSSVLNEPMMSNDDGSVELTDTVMRMSRNQKYDYTLRRIGGFGKF